MAFVSQEYPPNTHGGIGTQTYLKAHGLANFGHEVTVVSHSPDKSKHEYDEGPVHVIRIPSFDERLPIYTESARWLTYSAEVAVAVSELHARSPLDIVDFPEWGGEGYIHLLNQTKWNHIPTVVHIHGPMVMFAHTMGWPEINSEFYRIGTEMEGTCLRLADAIFSSSRCSADWCAKHYSLVRNKIPIMHSGVDTHLFQPLDIPKETRPTIIFVGKIEQNKGVELLLEASCQLAKDYPNLRLRMLGGGNAALTKKLKEKVRASGLPDLLDLVGYVERQDLPAHLSRAHIFAAPSIYEGGPGFVYLEAMACGLPVIACEGSGAAEVITPEENGFLIPSGDVDALTKTLHRLLSNQEERLEMGKRARRYVLREADSQICLKRLEAFYESVLSGENK